MVNHKLIFPHRFIKKDILKDLGLSIDRIPTKIVFKQRWHPDLDRHTGKNAICRALAEHSDDLKDDPERLTTEFIQRLVERKR